MNTQNTSNNELMIDDEFKSLIRPLSLTEYNQLEESIKQNGCQSPIVVWKSRNIILDGHNRFEICMKDNIEFETTNLEFLNDEQAKIWVIKNQFGRRNLSYYERASFALKLESIIKEEARKKQLSKLQNVVNQNSDEREMSEEINTNKYLAKISNVSHDTIARVRKIEEVADDETKKLLIKGKLSINKVFLKITKPEIKDHVKKSKRKIYGVEKPTVIYTDYLFIKRKEEQSMMRILVEGSIVFVWSTVDKLAFTFAKMKAAKLKYVNCLVWDRGNEKSPMFLVVFSVEKPDDKKYEVIPVYRENASTDNKIPSYYDELIKKMFSDKAIMKRFRD